MTDVIQLAAATRNAMGAAIETDIGASPKFQLWTGTVPASVAASPGGTKVWEGAGDTDWLGAWSSGEASLTGTSPSASCTADGTVTFMRICTSAGTAKYQTPVTQGVELSTSSTTAVGSNVLNFSSTTGVSVGMAVFGTGVPTDAVVVSKTSTTVTLDKISTAGVGSAVAVQFVTAGASRYAIKMANTAVTNGQTFTLGALTIVMPGA
jgi:hypothetical protein